MDYLIQLTAAINLDWVIDKMDIGPASYLVMFGLLFSCGLGVPIPEDIPLLVAGMQCGKGNMLWPLAALVGWLGIIGGDCCLYFFGHRFGHNITKVPMVGKHVTEERILKAEKLFEKYGVWVVGVGRLFAGIRGAMVVAAGTIRFSFVKFIIADGLAALVSGGLFLFLGYKFGEHLQDVEHAIKHFGGLIVAGLVVLIVLWLVYGWWRHKHKKTPSQVLLDEVVKVGPVSTVTHTTETAGPLP